MTAPRFVLRVHATNMRVEMRVNDIPVASFAPGEAQSQAEVPLNEFLLSRDNVVTAIVNANPLPSRVAEPWGIGEQSSVNLGQPAALQATVVREDDSKPNPGFKPVHLAWKGLALTTPSQIEQRFLSGIEWPVWAWSRARELPVVEGVATGYQALLQVRALLDRKDVAAVVHAMAIKLEEITEGAYGVPAGPLRAAFTKGLSRCFSDAAFALLPCEPHDLDLRLVAGRRLVEFVRRDGRHALTYAKSGSSETFFLPTMVGYYQSRWQVLR